MFERAPAPTGASRPPAPTGASPAALADGAELGGGWVHYVDDAHGKSYFYHAASQRTQWHHPFEPQHEAADARTSASAWRDIDLDAGAGTSASSSAAAWQRPRASSADNDLACESAAAASAADNLMSLIASAADIRHPLADGYVPPVEAPAAVEASAVDGSVFSAPEPQAVEANVPEACWQMVLEASQVEERAMTFDRAGAYPGAVKLYREASGALAKAANMCPAGHADVPVIGRHLQEVEFRAAYLDSLGVEPAEIPIEEHIHGARLTMGPPQTQGSTKQIGKGAKVAGSAAMVGAAAGLLLIGPHVAVVAAAGAAYSTTRKDTAGTVSRKVGEVGLAAAGKASRSTYVKAATDSAKENARAVDETLRLSETARAVDETLHISESAASAAEATAAKLDKLRFADKAHAAVDKTALLSKDAAISSAKALKEFNDKYDVTGKVGTGLISAASTGYDLGCKLYGWSSKSKAKASSS